MRILSQDSYTEKYDIPYDNVAITYSKYMEGRWRIYAQGSLFGINPNENFVQIAEYSTAEKAKKALDMLNKAYAGLPIIMRNVDITDDVAEMLKEWKKQGIIYRTENDEPSKIEVMNNGYFRFPADSEIEA